ncbi:hypothetical protein POM88_015604 [Heracleum sosnowskyi]|uniref:EF-hand domain-containing protein n=1 Tax=Heracleum sosnowskyi TaxID=360622 RepID=A0AAD8IKZ9_9APIA|nr:hypothetical protein POM88_015604 [Heracleum sosnowskyi]
MERLHSIADTYYRALSTEDQKKVLGFISSMDKDGSGFIDIFEFKQYLKEHGYNDYAGSDIFKKLDMVGDNRLGHSEMLNLFYIILSGRPFCMGCEDFIMAEYFVCVECFQKSSAPVYLCLTCYKNRNYKHSHGINENPLFLDTYAMLECKRLSALAENGQASNAPSSSKTAPSSSKTSTSRRIGAIAFKTFETALGLANLQVELVGAGIAAGIGAGSGCTIM